MKAIAISFLLIFAISTYAGGWSDWAVPTQIDMERGNGIMVYGEFGNPSDCAITNKFYIQKTHPEYDKIYGVVLAAFSAQKELRAYSHKCGAVGWYTATPNAFNFVSDGAVNIRH